MSFGTYKVVQGDVTNPQRTNEDEIVVIPHVCNNVGVMGAGVALAIKKKWPKAYEDYVRLFKVSTGEDALGFAEIVPVDNLTYVCNMIAQDGFMSDDNPKPIRYASLVKCMQTVLYYIKSFKFDEQFPVIHCPKFGSLRSGGNWDFILELINEIWINNGIDVVVYEWK